ncbi:ThiF family adenylyltransferase, partial [Staphylococcus haemolyticus]|uniref:ThiF family adenylyltransferase n=1 Tax=Staphylococcus haemolyticus TaxID=1283 RepID=UPI00374E8430
EVKGDTVMDGMDDFKIGYVMNEVCEKDEIGWVYGGGVGNKGRVYGIDLKGGCVKWVLKEMG